MKKILVVLFVVVLAISFSFIGCKKEEKPVVPAVTDQPAQPAPPAATDAKKVEPVKAPVKK
jgi:hypothetical protein